MPPVRGHVPGVLASNIIEGSRKRKGGQDVDASSPPSASEAAGASASSSQPSSSHLRTGPTEPEEVARLGYKLLNVIYHVRDVADDDPQSLLCEPFLVLPDAELYADYYQVIRRPLTFEDVRHKLAARGYGSLEEAKHDCEVVCQNAKRYNLKDTPIWLKARALHGIIKDAFADLVLSPDAASTKLESSFPLLEEGPDDVEPITSQPPSPGKVAPMELPAPVSSSPSGMSGKGTRITLKRKPSNLEKQEQKASTSRGASKASPVYEAGVHDDDDAEGEDDGDVDGDVTMGDIGDPEAKKKRPGGRGRKLKSQMKGWANELLSLKKPDGTSASEFFRILPSRDDYPDYYTIITAPVSFKEITDNVRTRGYKTPFAFVTDVRAMIANAKWYNEQHSIVWQDADVLEKHLDGKVIPGLLSEGFTLDPNDTRASVLPPYMQNDSGGSASPAPPTPQQPQHAQLHGQAQPRVKIKLAGRPSSSGSQALPAPGPPGVKAEPSPAGAASPVATGAVHSPLAAPQRPAGSPSYQQQQQQQHQQHQQRMPSSTPTPGPAATTATPSSAPSLSASGRPLRNATSAAPRGASPQMLTGGASSPPAQGRSPIQGGAGLSPSLRAPGGTPGGYFPPMQHQQQRNPHAMSPFPAGSPSSAVRSYATLPGGVPHPNYPHGGPLQQQQQQLGGFPPASAGVRPSFPPSYHVSASTGTPQQQLYPPQQQKSQQGRLSGPLPLSSFASPSVYLAEKDTTIRRPAAIRSFVLLKGARAGRKSVCKVVHLDEDGGGADNRQVVISVADDDGISEDASREGTASSNGTASTGTRHSRAQECILLFKVQDFPRQDASTAAEGDADADASADADAEGEDDDDEAPAVQKRANGHAAPVRMNGVTDSNGNGDMELATPPLPKSRTRTWRPYIALTINGYSIPLRWHRNAAEASAASAQGGDGSSDAEADEEDERAAFASDSSHKAVPSSRSPATPYPTLLPANAARSVASLDLGGARLQRGTNVIDVEMAPPPPASSELRALAEKSVDEETRAKAQWAIGATERYRLFVTR